MSPRVLSRVAPLAIVGLLGIAACADDDGTTPLSADTTTAAATTTGAATGGGTTSIATVEDLQEALKDGDLSTIAQAVNLIGVDKLIGDREYTFFAPNNDAFSSLSRSELTELLANPTELDDVLKNHLVTEKLTAEDLQGMTEVETAAGNTLPVVVNGGTVTVGGAEVVQADREAGPGVIHVIDTVLLIES